MKSEAAEIKKGSHLSIQSSGQSSAQSVPSSTQTAGQPSDQARSTASLQSASPSVDEVQDAASSDSSSHNANALLRFNDPYVIGTGALVLGYVIGSGRWEWFGKRLAGISGSLGTFAFSYFLESFRKHNPQFFNENK